MNLIGTMIVTMKMHTIWHFYCNPFIPKKERGNLTSNEEDTYALCEVLQFIYHSAIRDGKEILIYIPSRRIRNLLTNFIKENIDTDIENTNN